MLIEQAEALGEPPEDPLLLFSVLLGFWTVNYMAFNGEVIRELAARFLTLAEKQRATVPLMIGHSLMAVSLLTGDMARGRAHSDRASRSTIPPHIVRWRRGLAKTGVAILSYRAPALLLLGYPDAALVDAERAQGCSRDRPSSYFDARVGSSWLVIFAAEITPKQPRSADELLVLADEKGALFWKAGAMMARGYAFAVTGKASDAVQTITSGMAAWRSTGSTNWLPLRLSHLASAHADLGQFDDAWRCIGEAMTAVETTRKRGSRPISSYRRGNRVEIAQAGSGEGESIFRTRARGCA